MNTDILDKEGYRKFGITMALVIALLFGLFFPWVFSNNIPYWPWIVAAVFTLLALVLPMKLAVIHKLWMKFGHIIGAVNTKIILSIVFFLVFTPMALLFKLLGKDPLKRDIANKSLTSYWEESKQQSKEHMEKVY